MKGKEIKRVQGHKVSNGFWEIYIDGQLILSVYSKKTYELILELLIARMEGGKRK